MCVNKLYIPCANKFSSVFLSVHEKRSFFIFAMTSLDDAMYSRRANVRRAGEFVADGNSYDDQCNAMRCKNMSRACRNDVEVPMTKTEARAA